MSVRALKRRLEVLKHQPPQVSKPEAVASGKKLLEAAQEEHAQRKQDTARNIYDCSYEAAGDMINLGKGRVFTYGGYGTGYRLGAGQWKYINGKWEKKE